jgi:DNA invertase Pin-like site-specific DNA recombinase
MRIVAVIVICSLSSYFIPSEEGDNKKESTQNNKKPNSNSNLYLLSRLTNIATRFAGISPCRRGVLSSTIIVLILAGAFKLISISIDWSFYTTVWAFTSGAGVYYATVAGIPFEKAKEIIDAVILYNRVSSQEQARKFGKDRQSDLESEYERLDTDGFYDIDLEWESGTSMIRESIDIILKIIQSEGDKRFCLMLENLDRLSRAKPFEATTFLWLIQQFGALIYVDGLGYFDLSDVNQQQVIYRELDQARKDLNRTRENTREGRKTVKEHGGFPTRAPYGYKKQPIESGNTDLEVLRRDPREATVLRELYELIVEKGLSLDEATNTLSDEYDGSDTKIPTNPTFKRIFDRTRYHGGIMHQGEIVGECPPIFSKDEMHEVRSRLELDGDIGKHVSENNSENQQSSLQIDNEFVKLVFETFGVDDAINRFDVIKGKCPRCGDDVKKRGSTTRRGHRVNKYQCVNHPGGDGEAADGPTESDQESLDTRLSQDATSPDNSKRCNFEGPLLNGSILSDWDQTLPLTCPQCERVLDDEEWENDRSRLNSITQICDCCGLSVSVNAAESRHERVIGNIRHALDIFDDDNTDTEEESGSRDASDSASEESSDANEESDNNSKMGLSHWN